MQERFAVFYGSRIGKEYMNQVNNPPHCPKCKEDVEEGRAFCPYCGEPLTVYADASDFKGPNAAKKEKVARLDIKPPAIYEMMALLISWTLFSPVGSLVHLFTHRTVTNSSGTNYLNASFGALQVIFYAAFLIPVSLAILFLAYSAWTQKRWAWNACLLFLTVPLFSSLLGYWPASGFWRLAWILFILHAGYFWLLARTREWYACV